jgi:carbon storage regulator
MLVLSRREDESILIGDDVEVVVLSIGWGKVRLGIRAPRGVRVDRDEVRAALLAGAAPPGGPPPEPAAAAPPAAGGSEGGAT